MKFKARSFILLSAICLIPACSENVTGQTSEKDKYLNSTLIIDEIPGRIVGDEDYPPGRLTHVDDQGNILFETDILKMPYDAVRMEDGSYWVSLPLANNN